MLERLKSVMMVLQELTDLDETLQPIATQIKGGDGQLWMMPRFRWGVLWTGWIWTRRSWRR